MMSINSQDTQLNVAALSGLSDLIAPKKGQAARAHTPGYLYRLYYMMSSTPNGILNYGEVHA